jgi:hypothetical protein
VVLAFDQQLVDVSPELHVAIVHGDLAGQRQDGDVFDLALGNLES